jgi:hypothetical protein
MQSIKVKSVTLSLLSSLTLLGISFTTAESARADLFGDLKRGVDRVNETITTGNVIFFKFKEISIVTAPIKDRFLAFAFCLSSESTSCK